MNIIVFEIFLSHFFWADVSKFFFISIQFFKNNNFQQKICCPVAYFGRFSLFARSLPSHDTWEWGRRFLFDFWLELMELSVLSDWSESQKASKRCDKIHFKSAAQPFIGIFACVHQSFGSPNSFFTQSNLLNDWLPHSPSFIGREGSCHIARYAPLTQNKTRLKLCNICFNIYYETGS